MPVCLDIYILSEKRNQEIITWFLNEYVDQEQYVIMEGELQITPLKKSEENLELKDYDWERTISLTHAIKRGLDYPRRAFSLYLKAQKPNIYQAIISFTSDNKIILGLSVEDFPENEKNLQYAAKLLRALMTKINTNYGICIVEEPPPANQAEFIKLFHSDRNLLKKFNKYD